MAGDKLKDSTPNEHEAVGIGNYNNADYATDNQYGQDLSGISYKDGIDKHFGGDGSIGGNDVKDMMAAGYSADDIYNFSKKRGLNYNKHGREYLQREGDYNIGKGKDQWGDVFGYKSDDGGGSDGGGSDDGGGNTGGGSGGGIDMGDTQQTINPGNPGEVGGGGGFPGNGSGLDNSTNVNVNQDNDIVNSISGSNNTVNNAQDNSVNTMGGNAKSFNGTRGSMFKDAWMQNFFS